MKHLERKQMNAVKAGAGKKTTVVVAIQDGASRVIAPTVLPLFIG